MAPPGFAPVQNNGQNRFNQNQVQGNNFNRGNNFHGNQGFHAQNNHAPNVQNQGFQNQPFQMPNNQVQQEISNDFFKLQEGIMISVEKYAKSNLLVERSWKGYHTKKTKNKAKTTKPDSEWKSCEGQSQSRAKDQKSQSQSQLNKLTVKTGAVIEEYYWLQSQPI
ncbi:hypothetical protein Tco_0563633 [Tanacetum coccineum]